MTSTAALPATPLPATPLSRSLLARERILPVAAPLRPLLPEGGLVRGRTVACGGSAAMSLALALAVDAAAEGSWVAVVDVPALGLEAAEEFGIPLERVVRVDPGTRRPGAATWAELLAAVLDGFEVVITRVPGSVSAGLARKVQTRLTTREAVVITVGRGGELSVDVELRATDPRWEGVGIGAGHLRGRRVTVTSSGRRVPASRTATMWLPGPDGRVADVVPDATGLTLRDELDPLLDPAPDHQTGQESIGSLTRRDIDATDDVESPDGRSSLDLAG